MSTIVTRASKGSPLTWTEADNNFKNLNYSTSISVKDSAYGAKGDGITDDTAAIQAAIDSLGAGGGIVSCTGKLYIASNLYVKPSVFLVGSFDMPGKPTVGSGTTTDYALITSSIRLASTATIYLQGGAGLRSLLIYRYGMTFPAPNPNSFAGTAVTSTGDDTSIMKCMIMGFNKAVLSSGCARIRIDYLYHDNINGIEITNCDDVPHLTNCHAWPWSTIASLGLHTTIERTGIAYHLHDFVDWAKVTDCFCYGYAIGFKVDNANSTTFSCCGADNTINVVPLNTGSVGFSLVNTCHETKFIGCQAAAQDLAGIVINVTAGRSTFISQQTIWGGNSHGILVQSGDVVVTGGQVRGVASGVTVTNATSNIFLNGLTFTDIVTLPITAQVSTERMYLNNCFFTNFTGNPMSLNVTSTSIASAATVILPNNGDTFIITGTTSFGTLGYGWLGREVVLLFTGVLTVFNGTGSVTNMRLLGGANLPTGAGTVLMLRHNGIQWYEIGRI